MDFVNKETFSDVKLYYTEDKFIYGHKILLSSIDYFNNYFTRWHDKEAMTIEFINSESFIHDYIAYIYSISSNQNYIKYITNKYKYVSLQYILDLIKISNYYQFNDKILDDIYSLLINNIVFINDYEIDIKILKDFLEYIDPYIYKNIKFTRIIRYILCNFGAQLIFGKNLYNCCTKKKWTYYVIDVVKKLILYNSYPLQDIRTHEIIKNIENRENINTKKFDTNEFHYLLGQITTSNTMIKYIQENNLIETALKDDNYSDILIEKSIEDFLTPLFIC